MIFYFSATGNTLWAAQRVAQVTGERLLSVAELIESQHAFALGKDERVGFIYPIYGWRPPVIMREFVRKLTLTTQQPSDNLSSHYCFALCTAGDDLGLSMDYLNSDLKTVGLQTNATFSLKMPNTYVGLPFMDIDSEEVIHKKREKAEVQLREYCEQIFDRIHCKNQRNHSHWPRINSNILGAFFVNKLITDKPFHVEKQRCVKCGICANVCPVDNIEGGHGLMPKWKHTNRCLTCFACYHHCPHHAIEYGRQTQHKGQYVFK